MTSVVSANGITHRYGDRAALDGFTIDVPSGSVFGLLGPNGSGKSTFMSLVAAMEHPQAGTLTVFGAQPAAALRARTGTVFQENAQDPLMSPQETLALAARLFGLPRAAADARASALLARFGLGDRAGDGIATLSGGMRRRLEMARALMHEPALLLLDEPTTGVDPGERRALWDALRDSSERTVVLASNDLAEADSVCDVVAFIDAGRVVASGTPGQLKRGLRKESVRLDWTDVTPTQLATVGSWAGVGDVVFPGDSVHLTVDDASALVPRLFELAPGAIRGVTIHAATLEDAYFRHVRARDNLHQEVTA